MYHATYAASFTDYEMFKPQGGIWVPAMQFNWAVNAKADFGPAPKFPKGAWVPTNVAKVKVTPNPIVYNRTWPTWAGLAQSYLYWS